MGTVLLLVATAVVVTAAWLIAQWALGERAGAGLRLVGTGVLAHTLILAPTWLLGAADVLTRARVVVAVVAVAVVGALLAVGRGGRAPAIARLRADVAAMRATFRRARREHGAVMWMTGLGAVIAAWYLLTTLFCAPTGEGDAVFYHEPIVALTLQHGSLGPFDLPRGLQRVNGMPRFINLLQLWFATFTGRSHVELATIVWVPFGMVGMFQLARTVGARVGHAWLSALLWALMPGMLRLSAGILVDVPSAGITTAALALVTAQPTRISGVILAAGAVGLVSGTKYHLIAAAAGLGLALAVNVVLRGRWSFAGRAILVGGAAVVVLAALSATVVWNYQHYDNPVWPVGLKVPALGVDFSSPNSDLTDGLASGTAIETSDVLSRWLSAPYSRSPWGGGGARPEDYGPAVRYLFWPLGVIGALWAAVLAVRALVRRRRETLNRLAPMLGAGALLAAAYTGFPSVVRGRYWLPVISAMIMGTLWLLSDRRQRRHLDLVIAAACAMTLAAIPWAYQRRLLPQWDDVTAAIAAEPEARAWVGRRWTHIVPKTGEARARDMTAGKRVGFFRYVQPLGLLWNDDYSNEVHYLGPAATSPERADALDIDWLVLRRRGVQRVGFPKGVYEWVGKLQKRRGQRPYVVYRKRDDAPRPSARPAAVSRDRQLDRLFDDEGESEPEPPPGDDDLVEDEPEDEGRDDGEEAP